ncbi:MAG: amidase [Acidobacteriota bacterium]|nr:MAG: amidase [Acidobacteriota bacterium]
MAGFSDYSEYDAVGLAELVRQGEVTPGELREEAATRIEKVNPQLNAVVTKTFDLAEQMIESLPADASFRGVPFLIKDLVEMVAGVRLTMGCRACKDFVPSDDTEMVARFRAAGLIFLGKTNVPELGLAGVTESQLLGPCRNPWNLDHTPGGSSGGSAAAVAAGIVPVASANDGGGSIRIPASCCGLFGLKPSRGRTPAGPFAAEFWQGAAVSHALSRTVRDSAALLDAVAGPEPGSPYLCNSPEESYRKLTQRDPRPLRIAFSVKSPLGTGIHPECEKAVLKTCELLEELGHVVVEAEPEINGRRLIESFICLVCAETAADLSQLGMILGRKVRASEIEPVTGVLALLGRALKARDLSMARRYWGAVGRKMGRFHLEHDLYLTPSLGTPPVRVGEMDPSRAERILIGGFSRLGAGGALLKLAGVVDQMADKVFSRVPFTQLANLTGQPAMSVPLHWTEDGLPCGVQFMAPLNDEATLFQLAGQLERARPWTERRPPVWAG